MLLLLLLACLTVLPLAVFVHYMGALLGQQLKLVSKNVTVNEQIHALDYEYFWTDNDRSDNAWSDTARCPEAASGATGTETAETTTRHLRNPWDKGSPLANWLAFCCDER